MDERLSADDYDAGVPTWQLCDECAARGLDLVRTPVAEPFLCVVCGHEKKSKLRAFPDGDRTKPICNGCYGTLTSL